MPESTARPPVRWNVCPDCLGRHENGAACLDEPRTETVREEDIRHAAATTGHVAANAVTVETEDPDAARTALRTRIGKALAYRVLGGRNVSALELADAVLPVVAEMVAEAERRAERAKVSDDPTAATYSGYLDRAENAEDRLRKAERRVEHFEEHAAQINADLGIETQRAEQAERQRDQAIAALTHHAAEAHRRKWRHDGDNPAAFDALHRLGDEILASRDRVLAALDADQPKNPA